MKKYKLLKDTICSMLNHQSIVKAGTELKYYVNRYVTVGSGWTFSKEFVENTPEWFELIQEQKSWEIQCLVVANKNYWVQKNGLYHSDPFTGDYYADEIMKWKDFKLIHSVKRLSDGCIMSVGSKEYSYGKPCKIISFRVMENGCMWCCVEFENGNKYENLNILALDKIPSNYNTEEAPKTGLAIDIRKGTMDEAIQLGKLWQKFQPSVINSIRPEQKIPLPKDFIDFKSVRFASQSGRTIPLTEIVNDYLKTVVESSAFDGSKIKRCLLDEQMQWKEENIIRNVYNSLIFETNAGEKLFLCMRDSGYEIKYGETSWEFKNGKVTPMGDKQPAEKYWAVQKGTLEILECIHPLWQPYNWLTFKTKIEAEQYIDAHKIKKPPLGILPEWLWKEKRLDDIRQALNRFNAYHNNRKVAPKEWLDEKHRIEKWLFVRKVKRDFFPLPKFEEGNRFGKGIILDVKDNAFGVTLTVGHNNTDGCGGEILSFLLIKYQEIIDMKSFGVYPVNYYLNKTKTYSIYSVKRLSDGKIFKVGDKCKGGTIKRIIVRQINPVNTQKQIWFCTSKKNDHGFCMSNAVKK